MTWGCWRRSKPTPTPRAWRPERRARRDPCAKLLTRIPGVGALSGWVFLAEVGEIARFPDARHLVSFAGLAPRVRASGGRVHLGPVTKQGSRWLRWLFTEAASGLSPAMSWTAWWRGARHC